MTFKSKVQEDAYYVFLNTNEFAETIQYTSNGGIAKTIKAIIDRDNVGPDSQSQDRSSRHRCVIHISIDDINGVASVTKGYDSANFPERLGGSSVDWRVVDIIGRDNGMWHLEMRQ